MARRKRQRATAKLEKTRTTREKQRPADRMRPPNHMISAMSLSSKKQDGEVWYNLVYLMKSSNNGAEPEGLVFVDNAYKAVKWVDREICCPPTWMDPQAFMREALKDPELAETLRKAPKAENARYVASLKAHLTRIFEQKWVVDFIKRFDEAAPYLAEWLHAYALNQEDTWRSKKKQPYNGDKGTD